MRSIAIYMLLVVMVPCYSTNAATTYTTEAAFLASVGPLAMESFESLPPHPVSFPGDLTTVVTPGFTITNSTSTNDFDIWAAPLPDVMHATDGNQYVLWFASAPSTSITFSFANAVNSFGVNLVDYGNPLNSDPLLFSTNGGDAGIAGLAPQLPNNEQFFGVFGNPFTTITFTRPTTQDAVTLDEVYFGTAVPEPASIGIGAFAFAALAVLRRRK
jgi:hypothetical protein